MNHSSALREFVAAWEGCSLHAYQDRAGVWTIGYGHTAGVKQGDAFDAQQAANWLDADLEIAATSVRTLVRIPLLTQAQFDVLTSFVFCFGEPAFTTSRLLKRVNVGSHCAAATELLRWNKVAGIVAHGLLARRAGEALIYTFGDYTGR